MGPTYNQMSWVLELRWWRSCGDDGNEAVGERGETAEDRDERPRLRGHERSAAEQGAAEQEGERERAGDSDCLQHDRDGRFGQRVAIEAAAGSRG